MKKVVIQFHTIHMTKNVQIAANLTDPEKKMKNEKKKNK